MFLCKKINVSVRDIADYSLNKGDIETHAGFSYKEAAFEGTQNHIRFQKEMIKEHGKESFTKEVYVDDLAENEEISMNITGRIDGLLKTDTQDGINTYIYEIKTTNRDINEVKPSDKPEHLGQAQCYACMYMKKHGLESIGVRLVYINRENQDSITFEYSYTYDEIQAIYSDLVLRYLNCITGIRKWQIIRDQSIERLEFPFSSYRNGQKRLMGKYITA